MRVISVNVGKPKDHDWQGQTITTAIFKHPIDGAAKIRTLGMDGDQQANLKSHGGVTKAVYAYPSEHYAAWKDELPDVDFSWGAFGENLTTEGLLEPQLSIGDTVRIGSAVLRVTEPRMPCQKLNVRFGRADMVKRFHQRRTSGAYFAVIKEGQVRAGDTIELVTHLDEGVPLEELSRLHAYDKHDYEAMLRVIDDGFVPEKWRTRFRERIDDAQG